MPRLSIVAAQFDAVEVNGSNGATSSFVRRARVCLFFSFALLGACASHEERARQLLVKAEAECRLDKGVLRHIGTSDDPKLEHRREGPADQEVIYVTVPDLRPETTDCINGVLRGGGYEMSRIITNSKGGAE